MMARSPAAPAAIAAAVLWGWLAVPGLAEAQSAVPQRDPLFGGVTVYAPTQGRTGFGPAAAGQGVTPTTPSTILERARRPVGQDGAACAGRVHIPQARIVCP